MLSDGPAPGKVASYTSGYPPPARSVDAPDVAPAAAANKTAIDAMTPAAGRSRATAGANASAAAHAPKRVTKKVTVNGSTPLT